MILILLMVVRIGLYGAGLAIGRLNTWIGLNVRVATVVIIGDGLNVVNVCVVNM